MAVRWFILQNPQSMGDVNPDIAENIPGDVSDRKTPRGELNWVNTRLILYAPHNSFFITLSLSLSLYTPISPI